MDLEQMLEVIRQMPEAEREQLMADLFRDYEMEGQIATAQRREGAEAAQTPFSDVSVTPGGQYQWRIASANPAGNIAAALRRGIGEYKRNQADDALQRMAQQRQAGRTGVAQGLLNPPSSATVFNPAGYNFPSVPNLLRNR